MILSWIHPTTGQTCPLDTPFLLANALPPGVLAALLQKEQADERHKGPHITITSGLGCPRKWAIQRMLRVPVNPGKMWAAQKGTWLHEQMGHAFAGVEGWYTEELNPTECTFSGTLFGLPMSCKLDARAQDFSAIWDYKFRGDFSAKFADPTGQAKVEDAAQLNMARMLMEQTTGLDLSGMEMKVWVDAKGWTPTFAPVMTEAEVGQVKPGSGVYTVAQIFEWLGAAAGAWVKLAEAEGVKPEELGEDILKVIIRNMPKVGEGMFRNKAGGNMCTGYCEVAEACFGLEGGV